MPSAPGPSGSWPPHVDPTNNDHQPRPFTNKVTTDNGLAVCATCGGALPAKWVGKDLLMADPQTGDINWEST